MNSRRIGYQKLCVLIYFCNFIKCFYQRLLFTVTRSKTMVNSISDLDHCKFQFFGMGITDKSHDHPPERWMLTTARQHCNHWPEIHTSAMVKILYISGRMTGATSGICVSVTSRVNSAKTKNKKCFIKTKCENFQASQHIRMATGPAASPQGRKRSQSIICSKGREYRNTKGRHTKLRQETNMRLKRSATQLYISKDKQACC